MENNGKQKLTLGKKILIVFLILIILLWVFMSWCWGFFTIMFLTEWGWYNLSMIWVPFFLAWLALIFGGTFFIKKIRKGKMKSENKKPKIEL